MQLNRAGADGFLSPHNHRIQSSNQVPKVMIDNGNRELYLLTTFRVFKLLYFPSSAVAQSAFAARLS